MIPAPRCLPCYCCSQVGKSICSRIRNASEWPVGGGCTVLHAGWVGLTDLERFQHDNNSHGLEQWPRQGGTMTTCCCCPLAPLRRDEDNGHCTPPCPGCASRYNTQHDARFTPHNESTGPSKVAIGAIAIDPSRPSTRGPTRPRPTDAQAKGTGTNLPVQSRYATSSTCNTSSLGGQIWRARRARQAQGTFRVLASPSDSLAAPERHIDRLQAARLADNGTYAYLSTGIAQPSSCAPCHTVSG